MSEYFSPGELFVYTNGDRWELGMVKRPNNSGDGYFCYYSRGDTAANTPTSCMHKLSNAGFTHIEQLLDAATVGTGTCHMEVHDNLDESEGMGDVWLECDECHWQMMLEPTTPRFNFCPNCGRRIEVDE